MDKTRENGIRVSADADADNARRMRRSVSNRDRCARLVGVLPRRGVNGVDMGDGVQSPTVGVDERLDGVHSLVATDPKEGVTVDEVGVDGDTR